MGQHFVSAAMGRSGITMHKWFRFKSAVRENALENYLAQFTVRELACLNDELLWGIYRSIEQKKNPYPTIDLVSHVVGVMAAKSGQIADTVSARAGARTALRFRLAKAASKLARKPKFENAMMYILPFQTGVSLEPDESHQHTSTDSLAVQRLSLHATMLERIYEYSVDAPLLPELEALGEATTWEHYWRT